MGTHFDGQAVGIIRQAEDRRGRANQQEIARMLSLALMRCHVEALHLNLKRLYE